MTALPVGGRKGRRGLARPVAGAALAAWLAACSPGDFGPIGGPSGHFPSAMAPALPAAEGESFGSGPVRVALLLPLSGDPALAEVGTSMANAARLAISYIEANDAIAENITVVLKDTGPDASGAARQASVAVAEGASLVLGPLRAGQVSAAGAVAKAAGIPLVGFSNNSGAAAPGVYLLNVLPETEVRRSLGFAKAQGRRALAGVFPTTDFGRIQESAFRQAASELGLAIRAIYNFGNEAEARRVAGQLAPLLVAGQIDTVFLPDRATAPSFGVLLEQSGVARGRAQIIGSADWNGDAAIAAMPWLHGAIYPALDDAGYAALAAEYRARFGGTPHPLATIAYTATMLANVSSLSMATPRYDRAQMTVANGFNGRDGVFRFRPDGRSEYALVIRQVTAGGATVVDGPKL